MPELTITLDSLLPVLGYRRYVALAIRFFKTFGSEIHWTRMIILENTLLYFALGVATVGIPKGFTIYHPLYPILPAIAFFGCIVAGIFEVDFMIAFPDAKFLWFDFHWQVWKTIPRNTAKTTGRKLIALGMYHATIFLVLGMLLAFALLAWN